MRGLLGRQPDIGPVLGLTDPHRCPAASLPRSPPTLRMIMIRCVQPATLWQVPQTDLAPFSRSLIADAAGLVGQLVP